MTLPAAPLYLDCHLLLDSTTLDRVRGLNRRIVDLAPGGIDFAQGRVPHLTLFMGLFPASREDAVRQAVEDLAGRFTPFALAFVGVEASRDGYLFLQAVSTEALCGWHARVVEALDPLRDGLVRQKFRDRRADYSPDEQARIDRYGFPWVLEAWRPHVTIGFVDPDRPEVGSAPLPPRMAARNIGFAPRQGAFRQPDVLAGLGEPAFDGRAVGIALGRVGEHGTVLEGPP